MKKQITLIGFIMLMVAATALIAADTKQDKGQKKEQKQKDDRGQDKPEKAKDQGNDNKGQGQDKDKQDKNDKGEGQGNSGDKGNGNDKNDQNGNNGNNGNSNGNGNNDDDDKGKGKKDFSDRNFKWDRESFKDRKNIRNGEKVTLCHKFNGGDEPAVTIRVSSNAMKAHLNHGDVEGECPAASTKSDWSSGFLKRRTDYYNELQEANEQLIYSRSILDYARDRLLFAQQQLAATDANRYTMAQIQQRQATVTNLEQNVTLLEALVATAATLLVNKLSD